MSKEYRLRLSEDQVRALQKACNLFVRIGVGELSSITTFTNLRPDLQMALTRKLCELEPMATGKQMGEYPRITETSKDVEMLFDIYQVLICGLTGNYEDMPIRVSTSQLPRLDIISN